MKLSLSSLNTDAGAGETTITLTVDGKDETSWAEGVSVASVTTSSSWLTVGYPQKAFPECFTRLIRWEANTGTGSRTGTVTFTLNSGETAVFGLTQGAAATSGGSGSGDGTGSGGSDSSDGGGETYSVVIPVGQAEYDGWFMARWKSVGEKEIEIEADDEFTMLGAWAKTPTPGVSGASYVPAKDTAKMEIRSTAADRVNFHLKNYGGAGYLRASGFDEILPFRIAVSSLDDGVEHLYFNNWTARAHAHGAVWIGECGRTATSNAEWLRVSCDLEGVWLDCDRNETGIPRTAEIVCTSYSGKTAYITYNQSNHDWDADGENFDVFVTAQIAEGSSSVVALGGGIVAIDIKANSIYSVVLDDALRAMGAVSNFSSGHSSARLEIFIPEGDGTERSGRVSIRSEVNEEDIVFVLVQAADAGYAILEMEVEPLTVPASGGTVTVRIETNTDWGFDFEALRSYWGGDLPQSVGSGSATLELEIPPNETGEARAGTLWVASGDASRTATVVQLAEDDGGGEAASVSVSPSSGTLSSRGGTLAATVTANEAAGALSASVSSSWLSAELYGGVLTVKAEKNTSETRTRAGTVTVSGENGGSATFSVAQSARTAGENVRLIPWSVSDGAAYVLLISSTDGAQTLSVYDAATKEAVATFDTDYPNESLGRIRYKASNDVIWLVHPERPVRWVKREDDYDNGGFKFSYGDYPFRIEPMLDFNVGAQLVTLTAEPHEVSTYKEGDIVYSTNQTTIAIDDVEFAVVEKGTSAIVNSDPSCNTPYDYGITIYCGEDVLRNIEDGSTVEVRGVNVSAVINGTSTTSEIVTQEFWRQKISSPIVGVFRRDTSGSAHVVIGELTVSATEDASGSYPRLSVSYTKEGDGEVNVYFQDTDRAFYECIQEVSDTSTPLTDENYWRKTFCVGRRLTMKFAEEVALPEAWRVGQHFALTAKAYAAESGNWDYNAEGEVSEPLLAFGTVTLKTEGGVWSGRLVLEMSLDDGKTWEFVDAVVSENGSANPQVTVDVDEIGALVRVRCDRREQATTRQALIPSDGGDVSYKTVANDTGCKWTLTCEGYSDIFVKIIEQAPGTYNEWIVECISGCPYPVSTTTWAEGAWNSRYGYPQTVTLHEERLCFAGNVKKPTTLWCSAINHYDDFRRGTLDTSSISVKPSSHSYGRAVWLASGAQLIMGTTLEEFSIGSRDSVAAMSGSNIVAKASASYGSADFDCEQSKSGIFSVLPGGKKIGVLNYDAVEEYTGTEVSQKAESLLASGVKELACVKAPQDMLYALCEDGTVAVLTYDFGQNVAGWSQFEILDGVETMCAVRRGASDVLVFVVNADGELVLGEIDPTADVWRDCGLPFVSECCPMPMEVSGNAAAGVTGKITQADVYLTAGRFFEYSFDGKAWYRHGEREKGRGWQEIFGRVELRQSGDWKDEATVMFRTDYAGPFVIAAVGAEIKRGS